MTNLPENNDIPSTPLPSEFTIFTQVQHTTQAGVGTNHVSINSHLDSRHHLLIDHMHERTQASDEDPIESSRLGRVCLAGIQNYIAQDKLIYQLKIFSRTIQI